MFLEIGIFYAHADDVNTGNNGKIAQKTALEGPESPGPTEIIKANSLLRHPLIDGTNTSIKIYQQQDDQLVDTTMDFASITRPLITTERTMNNHKNTVDKKHGSVGQLITRKLAVNDTANEPQHPNANGNDDDDGIVGDYNDEVNSTDSHNNNGKRLTKDTENATNNLHANHRIDNDGNGNDDPEIGQETIYSPNQRQFLIRPTNVDYHHLTGQQHHLLQQHQTAAIVAPAQLRNYPVTIRPHNSQQLEQSQEVGKLLITVF